MFNFVDDEEEVEDSGEFSFTSTIPTKKSAMADPEVRAKALKTRKRKTENSSYDVKRERGWSYCCAHKDHLPNLCERYQVTDNLTCTCPCHEERGFNYEDAVREYEDEEYIDLFD